MTKNVTLWLCQNSYWKWSFIVDFPMKNGGSFHSFLYVYQRVSYYCWLYFFFVLIHLYPIYILFIFHYTIIDHTSPRMISYKNHWSNFQWPPVAARVWNSPHAPRTLPESSPGGRAYEGYSSTNKQIIDDYCIYIYMKMGHHIIYIYVYIYIYIYRYQ